MDWSKAFPSQNQGLPLRTAVQDIYQHHLREVVQFNKIYKPTLGADIRQAIGDLRTEINRASKLYNKQTALRDADIALENLRDVIWAAYTVKCISEGQLGVWLEKLNKVGRMLGGWIKKVSASQTSK
ncbi:MAG: four helix bundle protein [Synergistaceae bacterium]|nr:four helix bundle protein [Synergistaceae bacterium]